MTKNCMKNQITNTLINLLPHPLVVAYSGGRDSHVLLHALVSLKANLRAIHINHGLQPDAGKWAQHCQAVCEAYGVDMTVLSLKIEKKSQESIEALAREARYAAFSQDLKEGEILLTAHMLEDQVETFFLQLLRGAGPLGLVGIAPKKGQIARPLLSINREQIQEYAKQHQLQWVEDPSNNNPQFRRNFLRHDILPQIKNIYPGFANCIIRSQTHIHDTQKLLDELLDKELLHCLNENKLNLTKLRIYSVTMQQQLVRHWLRKLKIDLPSTKKITTLLTQMLHAAQDANPIITVKEGEIRRFKNHLCFMKHHKFSSTTWDLRETLTLGNKTWQAKKTKGQGIKLPGNFLRVECRQGGERLQLPNRKHSSSLKKLLQSAQMPPWERSQLPLFYYDDQLVAVGSLFVSSDWQVVNQHQEGWVISIDVGEGQL